LFTIGNVFFVMGALISRGSPEKNKNVLICDLNFKKIVWFCIALHCIFLPLSWVEIHKIAAGAEDVFATAYRLRAASSSGEETVGPLVGNYLLAGLFFVPLLLIGWMQREIKSLTLGALAAPWVFLNILIAGRSGLIALFFSLFYIYISRGGKVKLKSSLLFGGGFVVILIAGNLLVGKIDAGIDDGAISIFRQSSKSFFDYFLQGPILFSEYFNRPNLVNPTWDALIFPCHVLEKFKLCALPSQHQGFMNFSQNGDTGNVYSIFFSIYPKYGWLGVIFLICGYGFWATFHHLRRSLTIFHLLIASFLFSAILLSVFADSFGPSIYFFSKIFIINLAASFAFKKT
ncbi:MAG: O-antigen polymerase, partial [Nitrososphaera sp.]